MKGVSLYERSENTRTWNELIRVPSTRYRDLLTQSVLACIDPVGDSSAAIDVTDNTVTAQSAPSPGLPTKKQKKNHTNGRTTRAGKNLPSSRGSSERGTRVQQWLVAKLL